MSILSDALRDSKQVHMLVELDFGGLVKRFAMRDISVPYATGNAKLFEGTIINLSDIQSRFDFRSFSYSNQSVRIKLANKDRFQDNEVRRKLEGGIGSIYLWAPGLDWAQIESAGLIFMGSFEADEYTRDRYCFNLNDLSDRKWKTLPETMITAEKWPNARTAGGAGSVIGTPQALVFGEWGKGIPLQCVNTVLFKYIAHVGVSKSVDADYIAGTVNVYNEAGVVIDPAGYVFYSGGIGMEDPISYFDFTADQTDNEPLSCSIQGLYDGGTAITGTVDQLIEHPAEIILYLMYNHSLFGLNEIHVESIKAMKNLLPGMRFATLINSKASGVDIMDRLLRQCLAGRISWGGKIGIMMPVTNSPNIGNIKWDHHLIGLSPRIFKTPIDNIQNKIRVCYGLNPTTHQYEGEFTLNRTNNEICRQSHYDYGEQPEYLFELPDVQEEGTARALGFRLVELKANRHDLIEIEVPYWDGIDYREGDAALLSIREGSSSSGAGWVDEKCILVERGFGLNTITQLWWRIS